METWKVQNKRWTEDEYFEMRKEVLSQWPTGAEIDSDEVIEYLKRLPPSKSRVDLNRRTRESGIPYLVKPCGRATIEEEIEHMQVQVEAGIDVIDFYPDTYTRKAQWANAQRGMEESKKQGRPMLNGFPLVNYGLRETRRATESVNIPLSYWSGADEDPRLAGEMGVAAGCNLGFSNVHDLIQHSRDYPLDLRIRNDQYICRMDAYYSEHAIPLDIYAPGNLQGWDPPEMKIALLISQTLIAVEQGAKHFTFPLVSSCHLIQNVAAMRVLRRQMREYLDKFGFTDVTVAVEYSTWQGGWPRDLWEAAALGAWDVTNGLLAGVDCFWIRGLDESHGLNTKEADVAAIKIAKKLIDLVGRQRLPEFEELKLEEEMITLAVRAIVDRIIDLGDGDVAIGEIKAVEQGVIDASFSPWIYLARKVLPVRDATGAIRFLDHGNIPLPKEVVEYHRQKIRDRENVEGKKADINMVIEDITFVSRRVTKEVIG